MTFYFAADRTLGKLAKWLRILGFDTTFELDVSAERFYTQLEKNRIVLTRNEKIKKKFRDDKLIFITSNHLDEQLKQVIAEIGIRPADTRPFSMCIHCNAPIVDVGLNEISGRVPDYIQETHNEFHTCLKCKRIFWPGSHTKRSMERIEHLFD